MNPSDALIQYTMVLHCFGRKILLAMTRNDCGAKYIRKHLTAGTCSANILSSEHGTEKAQAGGREETVGVEMGYNVTLIVR
jgi:hypothetical protein